MSKKTVPFTMPAGQRQRERAPVVLDGLTGESVPFAANEQDLRDAGSERKSDEWVRDSAPGAERSRSGRLLVARRGVRRGHDGRSFGRAESCGSDDVELRAAVRARMVLVGQRDRAAPAHVGRLRGRSSKGLRDQPADLLMDCVARIARRGRFGQVDCGDDRRAAGRPDDRDRIRGPMIAAPGFVADAP